MLFLTKKNCIGSTIMRNIRLKIRYVYWPFLLIMASILVLYTFLNWLLTVKLDLFHPKEILVDYALPAFVAWAACYIWLRPRIKLMNLMRRKGDDRFYFAYQVLAVIIMSIPLVITQYYLKTSTGKMIHLSSINDIKRCDPAKYYQVDTFYIDKSKTGLGTVFEITGRGFNKQLEMRIYLAVPMYNYATDALYSSLPPAAWYGMVFFEKVPNSWSYEDKEDAFQKFLTESERELEWLNLSDFVYLQKEGNTSDIEYFEEAVSKSQVSLKEAADPIILIPQEERFEDRLGGSLMWIVISLFGGFGLFFIMITVPPIDKSFLIHIRNKKRNLVKESVRAFFDPLLPSSGFKIIPILIFINTLIFLLMAILHESFMSFDVDTLISWGGSSRTLVFGYGEWWRLLANTFVHSGFIHFIMNMVILYFVGMMVEPILGSKNTLLVYLLTGIVASVVSLFFNKYSVSVGASGAIMGMCGLFGAFLLTKVFTKEVSRFLGMYFIVFIVYNLLIGLSGDVDNAAHLGGLVTGFALGIVFRFILRRAKRKRLQKNQNSSPQSHV